MYKQSEAFELLDKDEVQGVLSGAFYHPPPSEAPESDRARAKSSSGLSDFPDARNCRSCRVPISLLNSLRTFSESLSIHCRALAPTVMEARASIRTTEGVSVAP